jgi:DNA-binding NarL/FixJ family response regulator
VSLLGRLEDLSLTDIIQIVFLSRRTGVLEIVDDHGRHTVLFRHGLIVNASAPEHGDLVSYLEQKELISPQHSKTLRQMEDSGIAAGTAAVEMNLTTPDDLAAAIRSRILDVVTPLLQSREGEFNFILSDAMQPIDIEYEPDMVFKDGGFPPQKIVGSGEGEKIKPLRGLEDSLKAGKALLRGAVSEAAPSSLDLGLAQPAVAPSARAAESIPPVEAEPELSAPASEAAAGSSAEAPAAPAGETGNVVPFPQPSEAGSTPASEHPSPEGEATPSASRAKEGRFKVAGGLFEIESPEAQFRNVVLFERNPLVRVAAKRAFAKKNVKISQYGSLEDVRTAISEMFRSNSFFVTFLELTGDDAPVRLLEQLKRKNPRLPVVVIDTEADLRRRHDLLRVGADLYLTKPAPARLLPGLAEEELALFADELVLFAERAFQQWEQLTGGYGAEAGKRFYEMASRDSLERSFNVLKQLINELSDPNDIGEVSATILRLSSQYLDRGALFVARESEFAGLGGFGITNGGEEMDARVKRTRIPRGLPSILSDVAASGTAHRGKMKRTAVNVDLINRLGGLMPTEVVALPILHANRTIGILYGDNAEHRGPIDSVTGLEIFLSQAGYAFGNAVFASERAGRS